MLSRNLCYWKQVFPQKKPCAQTHQILHVPLYAHKQILPVEPLDKALWDQRVGKTSELTDFTHWDGGSKDTPSNRNLDLFFP